jgi:multidrug resistance efflux pump
MISAVKPDEPASNFQQRDNAFESHEVLAKRPAIPRKAIDKSRKAFERAQTQTKRDEARVAQLQAALHAAETNLSSISFRRLTEQWFRATSK